MKKLTVLLAMLVVFGSQAQDLKVENSYTYDATVYGDKYRKSELKELTLEVGKDSLLIKSTAQRTLLNTSYKILSRESRLNFDVYRVRRDKTNYIVYVAKRKFLSSSIGVEGADEHIVIN